MRDLRNLALISIFAICSYWAAANWDTMRSWFSPAPVAALRVEVPVPEVAVKEVAPEVEAIAPQPVVAHQPAAPVQAPAAPTKSAVAPVGQAAPVAQVAPVVKSAPVAPPAPAPQAVKAVEPVIPPAAQAAPEPAKSAVTATATAAAVTTAVVVEAKPAPSAPIPKPAPTLAQPAPPAKQAVQVVNPVIQPVAEALAEPVKGAVKSVSQVAAVIAVADTSPDQASPKESPAKNKPAPEKTKEIQLTIKDIQFTGVTIFPVKELSKVVSEFVGKELTVQEAFAIPAKVTQHYKRQNHMAIATLVGAISPDGVLTVGVVEMQMSQTQAEKELATLPVPATAPVLAAPTAPLPSKKDVESETDYILKNYAKKTRQYEILVDNYGHESTGSTRIGVGLALDDGRFSMLGFKSQGSDYLQMAVRWATGIEGLKLGANLSKLNYEVVNHLGSAIYQSGDAAKKGVELIYQLVNEPGHLSSLGLHYVSKSINSLGVNAADSSSITSSVPSLEWKGLLREMIPGGAVFSYSTTYAHGQVDTSGASTMGGLAVPEGIFSKFRFDGTVLQPLGGLGSVLGRLTFQKSDKNLDPSERLYLGGPLGVRAYGIGDGVGSEGGLLSLEFRQRLAAGTTLSEFYDWGGVRQVDDTRAATLLKGYGLSLSQDLGDGVSLKATWARTAGQHPEPTLPQDGDGQYDRNRFWLSMETRF